MSVWPWESTRRGEMGAWRREEAMMRNAALGVLLLSAAATPTPGYAAPNIVMAGPALRACSGIRGDAAPMRPEPLTAPDCLHLPGGELYSEAGRYYQGGDH